MIGWLIWCLFISAYLAAGELLLVLMMIGILISSPEDIELYLK
jgi:hypothetical protein